MSTASTSFETARPRASVIRNNDDGLQTNARLAKRNEVSRGPLAPCVGACLPFYTAPQRFTARIGNPLRLSSPPDSLLFRGSEPKLRHSRALDRRGFSP